ncbi:MAG: hypothetical protein H7096_01350 [Flavobacterium sp.]|nr:hypothetical protein [Pedobacter sp.]
MVITGQHLEDIKIDWINHIVLSSIHLQYTDDKLKFTTAVETLNCINRMVWINKACKDLGSTLHINTSIFYKAIDCTFKGEHLSNLEVELMFKEMAKVEIFQNSILKITDTGICYLGYELPFEICFAVHGLTIKEQDNLDREASMNLHDDYSPIYVDLISNSIDFKEYMVKVNELLNRTKNTTLHVA